ncbi:MAG: PAS domain S-box protein [Nitrospira sp.]|nr:PAS domain S-box protein [Nitrospira sp.]
MSHPGSLAELESLRRQVADLSRELAKHTDVLRDPQDRLNPETVKLRKQAESLRIIVRGTVGATGEDVIRMLVRHVAEALGVRYVFVGEWHEERPDHVRTLAVWSGTGYVEPFEYHLKGTPCRNVFDQRVCLYGSGVQERFPDDPILREMEVESYCGVRLSDHRGKPLGLLVIMDEKPLEDGAFIEDIMGVIAGRVASEIERTRIERERLRSLDLLHNVMETVPDIIFRLDLQGNLVGWNKRFELVTGLTPEELNQRPALAFVPEAEHAKTVAAIQRAFSEGYAELEGHLLANAGRQIPYHWIGAVLKDPAGRVIGVTGVGRDTSERKRTALELEQALDTLNLTQFSIDHAGDGFLWMGTDACILKANQASCRLLEYSLEELLAMTVHDLDPNMPPESWSAHWMELKANGSRTFEAKYWSQNGRIVYVEVTWDYLSYKGVEYCCAILRDIGERKRADAALRANEERLNLVLRATNDGVWDWDILTGDDYLSPQWKALLGFTDQELPNNENTFFLRLHPDDVSPLKAALEAHFHRSSPYDCEVRLRHRDGGYRWFRVRGEAIRDLEGRPYRMVGSIIDIAERKQAEEHERERLNRVIAFQEGQLQLDRLSHEDLVRDFQAIARIGAETVGVERVSIWLFQDDPSSLVCRDLYERSVNRHSEGAVLDPSCYPRYFQALERELLLAVTDARIDERTSQFAATYLEPLDIMSLMDIGVRRDGRIIGVVCFAATGTPREWSSEEQAFGASLADHVVLCLTDHERREAEDALRESEERFSKAFHEAAIGMALVSPDGSWLQVNHALCTILGYSPKELVNSPMEAVTHPSDRYANSRFMSGVLNGDLRTFHLETRYLHKQGHVVWIILSLSLMRNTDRSPRHLIVQIQDISERRLAEAAVRESEEMHRALFEQGPLMCFLIDARGTLIKVNRFGAEALGYEVSELLGRSVLTVFPEAGRKRAMEHIANSLAGPSDALNTWELQKRRKDGSKIWARVFARVVIDREGKPTVLMSCEDITDQKRTEDILRLTRYAVEQAGDQIFLIRDDGSFLDVNESACRHLGYSRQELLTMSVMDIDPDFSRDVWNPFWEQFKQSKQMRLETRHRNKSGEIYPVEVTANYFVHNGCAIDCAIVRDISERKQAEEALRQSEGRFRSLFEHSPVAYQSLDITGRFINVNPVLCRLLGYREEELIGKEFGDLWVEDDLVRLPTIFDHFKRTNHLHNELALHHRDGSIVHVMIDGRVQRDQHGQFVRTHCILTDITERTKIEQALRQSEARLNEAQRLAHIGSWDLDLRTNRLSWSDEVYRIFETDPDHFDGSYEVFLSKVHPDDRAEVDHAYRTSLRYHTPYDIEHRLFLSDGEVRYVHERCETIYDAQGVPVRSFGTVQDVTERVRLLQQQMIRSVQLQRLSELSLTLSGDPTAIFEHVVRMIGELFDVSVVCLSEIVGPELQFRAVYENGRVMLDAGRCPLHVTPCATVAMEKDVCVIDRVMEWFPQDVFLRDHHAVSYCGFPALDAQGQVVAVICLLDETSREYTKEDQKLLRLFGQRLAVEIERGRLLAEQKQNAEKLQRSHAFIRQIIDTDPNCVFAKDGEGRYTLVNKATAAIFGTTPDGVLGKTDGDLHVDHAQVEFIREKDLAVMSSGQEVFIPEETITDSMGIIHWMQTVKRPVVDEQGATTLVLGVATDITARKRAEEALRVSLERFDLAVTASQDGLWDARVFADDPFNPHNPVYYSPRMKDIMGVEQDPVTDVIGAWASLLHPDDRDRIFAALTAHLTQRVPYDVEYRIVKPTGDIRWIAARGQAQWSEDGQPFRMSGSFSDITDRKRAEELLRQRERDLQSALDERERIAQDLHDGILQSLYATGLVLESCKPLFVQAHDATSVGQNPLDAYHQAIRQLNQVMSEVRNFIAGLESQILHGVDLATAIRSMVQSLDIVGTSCRVTIDEHVVGKLSTEQAFHLAYVTREALSNSLRHSGATQISVSLVGAADSVRLLISDNGTGFDPKKTHGVGHGLGNLAARARKIGGQLTVRTRPNYGTSIVIELSEDMTYADHTR